MPCFAYFQLHLRCVLEASVTSHLHPPSASPLCSVSSLPVPDKTRTVSALSLPYLSTTMQRVTLFAGTVPIAYTDAGKGSRTFLILHGGAGPRSVQSLVQTLSTHNRTIMPIHPGFDNEPRPAHFTSVNDLATAYLALLDHLALSDVVVVGNSVGGWIAAEMASRSPSRVSGIVIINGVGIDTEGTELSITNPTTVPPEQRSKLTWHDTSKFQLPQGEAALAHMQRNQQTIGVYASTAHFCYDPTLRGRLSASGGLGVPALVVWGESDRVVTVEYGRRYVEALGKHARLEVVKEAGHLPQLEKPDVTVKLITEFSQQTPAPAAQSQ